MAKNRLVVPFLKWVGGKRQLIPTIKKRLPKGLSNCSYYEPFIGGGALLFELQPKRAIINDYNEELINVYKVIRDNPDELIEDLKKHENTADYFYEIRAIDRKPSFKNLSKIERASRIIYLNKTCYIQKAEEPTKDEIVRIMKTSNLYNINSETTFRRRASTVLSWVNWILGIIEEEE